MSKEGGRSIKSIFVAARHSKELTAALARCHDRRHGGSRVGRHWQRSMDGVVGLQISQAVRRHRITKELRMHLIGINE
jgi:hypothetical protein